MLPNCASLFVRTDGELLLLVATGNLSMRVVVRKHSKKPQLSFRLAPWKRNGYHGGAKDIADCCSAGRWECCGPLVHAVHTVHCQVSSHTHLYLPTLCATRNHNNSSKLALCGMLRYITLSLLSLTFRKSGVALPGSIPCLPGFRVGGNRQQQSTAQS